MESFVQLYGHDVKPKFHYQIHLVTALRKIGRTLSCFSPERRHMVAKRSAATTFNHFESSITVGLIARFVHKMKDGGLEANYATNVQPAPEDVAVALQSYFGNDESEFGQVVEAHMFCGIVGDMDVLVVRADAGDPNQFVVGQVHKVFRKKK
jgi:hypothetical protein